MLINLSNHPSDKWDRLQASASIVEFQHTEDMPFPQIDPAASTDEVQKIAQKYFYKCLKMFEDYAQNVKQDKYNFAVHVQGEFTFVYAFVALCKINGIKCVASTSERKTIDLGNGKKELQFTFVQFREY